MKRMAVYSTTPLPGLVGPFEKCAFPTSMHCSYVPDGGSQCKSLQRGLTHVGTEALSLRQERVHPAVVGAGKHRRLEVVRQGTCSQVAAYVVLLKGTQLL